MNDSISAQRSQRRRKLALSGFALLAVAAVAVITISCGTITRTIMAPPAIPGATPIGTSGCADCHDEIVQQFATATHARLQAAGTNAMDVGCESCHGPGSLHSDSGGDVSLILNPDKSPEICLSCHLNARSEFALPSHHPVGDHRLACSDCHDSHSGPAHKWGGMALVSANEGCLTCHAAQRGPFIFEHEAVREGCTVCHRPHGSVNSKLLTERNAALCLKCHFQQQTAGGQILIGGANHTGLLSQGTCWSAGCHEAVHGSHVNSSLRF
jgi:predicted CXXCH cytochrome family protein